MHRKYVCVLVLVWTGWCQMPSANQEVPSASLPAYLKGYEDMLLTPPMKDSVPLEDLGAAAVRLRQVNPYLSRA